LAKLLRPIKNAILMLEGNQTNLADVFIQMIRLAYSIKNFNSSNLIAFQRHAVQAFNKRWEEFDISLYLLAYFLHPRFRGTVHILYFLSINYSIIRGVPEIS